MKKISIQLEFSGAIIPVGKDEQGIDVVPLKPIADAIGVNWEEQRKKIRPIVKASEGEIAPAGESCPGNFNGAGSTWGVESNGAGFDNDEQLYYSRRLGICLTSLYFAGQTREMVCIRLDRVTAWLYTINPLRVRAAGNIGAADYLEQKHIEWDNLLNEYEGATGTFGKQAQSESTGRAAAMRMFIALSREKRATAHESDRTALDQLSKQVAEELGIPYQLALPG